ncbi:MAG: hypothetical protein K0B37_02545 [Bacteroidales bacterium]|nr:hypothetical protein [Bacteroidales bacterium]
MKKKNLFSLAMMLMAAAMLSFTACSKDDDDDINGDDEVPEGIVGDWSSEGDDVAPLLVANGFNAIKAYFNEDGTYLVEGFLESGGKIDFVGVYSQSESNVNGIWNIELIQSAPSSATSVGIFQIEETADGRKMTYEVAQVEPSIVGVTPPTPEGGFGSTSEGAFGNLNVQVFYEITE